MSEKELKECCGAYSSEAGCCPFPLSEEKEEELKKEEEWSLFGKPALDNDNE